MHAYRSGTPGSCPIASLNELAIVTLLCFLATITNQPVVAQSDINSNSTDTIRSYVQIGDPIRITSTKFKTLINYSELPSNTLQIQDGFHIAQSLNTVPGVFMHSGTLNTNRITIRGIGNRSRFSTAKIKAYLDEIPLTNGVGETTIEDIDLGILDRIDVWKGPTASSYGAGLGGIIHLQTDNNTTDEVALSGTSSFRSYGGRGFLGKVRFGNAERKVQTMLSYNKLHNDGYRANNEYDRESTTILNKSEVFKGKLAVLMNYIDLKSFIPSSLNRSDFLSNPRQAASNWSAVQGFEDYDKWLIGTSYNRRIARQLGLQVSLSAAGRDAYESRPFNILTENSLFLTSRILMEHRSLLNGRLYVTAGLELFHERYDWEIYETLNGIQGERMTQNRENRANQNYFAEVECLLTDRLKILAGLNLNQTSYNLDDRFDDAIDLSGDYSFDNILSPRLVVNYTFSNSSFVFATVSHGFSAPTLEETLTPSGLINPDIQPERGWNIELGTKGSLMEDKFNYEFSIYSMLIKDLLVSRRVEQDQFQGINAGKTQHNGFETQVSYRLVENLNSTWIFQLSYQYQDYTFKEFTDGNFEFSGNDLTGSSPHLVNALLNFEHRGIFGNINYEFVDAMPLRDDNSIYSESHQLTNIKVGYRFRGSDNWLLEIFGGIANLFNERYASMYLINAASFGGSEPRYYYPGLPRNYYGGIRIKLLI